MRLGHQMVTHSAFLELHLTLMEAVLIYLRQCAVIQQTVSLKVEIPGLSAYRLLSVSLKG